MTKASFCSFLSSLKAVLWLVAYESLMRGGRRWRSGHLFESFLRMHAWAQILSQYLYLVATLDVRQWKIRRLKYRGQKARGISRMHPPKLEMRWSSSISRRRWWVITQTTMVRMMRYESLVCVPINSFGPRNFKSNAIKISDNDGQHTSSSSFSGASGEMRRMLAGKQHLFNGFREIFGSPLNGEWTRV